MRPLGIPGRVHFASEVGGIQKGGGWCTEHWTRALPLSRSPHTKALKHSTLWHVRTHRSRSYRARTRAFMSSTKPMYKPELAVPRHTERRPETFRRPILERLPNHRNPEYGVFLQLESDLRRGCSDPVIPDAYARTIGARHALVAAIAKVGLFTLANSRWYRTRRPRHGQEFPR